MNIAIRPDLVSKELESDLDNSNLLYSLPVGNGEIKGTTGSISPTTQSNCVLSVLFSGMEARPYLARALSVSAFFRAITEAFRHQAHVLLHRSDSSF